jgi:APA family basic amino acid/polyamine antiporter
LNIWARKPVEELCSEAGVNGEVTALPRSIGVFALTCIGVGATVGAGIFVLTGSVAAEHSGPAVGISFLLASIVCLLAGLCYAELAAMIPVAGSAYSYTYATMGEGIAWTVGWCLMLEYLFSASLVAISWAGYAQSTLHQLGVDLPAAWMAAPFDVRDGWHIYRTTTLINLPAVLITALCTLVLLGGLKTSARLNNVMVVAKVIAILVVVFVGAGHVHTSLWHPYIPPNAGAFGVYGWSGVFQGTAILFFAYIGFDAVSTMGQEARNPQRTIPLSLLLGLAICAVLYLAVSFVVTGLVGYKDLGVPDPRSGGSLGAVGQVSGGVRGRRGTGLGAAGDPDGSGQNLLRHGTRRTAARSLRARASEDPHPAYRDHRDRDRVLHRRRPAAAGSAGRHHLHGHAARVRHRVRGRTDAAADPP